MATSADPTDQTLTIPVGCDVTVQVSLSPSGSIAGYTFAFYVVDSAGATVFSYTSGSGITVSSEANGVIDVALADDQTDLLTAGAAYRWSVWRTNAGAEHKMADGKLIVTYPDRA